MMVVAGEVVHLAFLMRDCHAYFGAAVNATAKPMGLCEGGFDIALLS